MTSRGLRIWLITVGEPLPRFAASDRLWRSGYLATLLASQGHEVTWWASSFDHFRRQQLVSKSERVQIDDRLDVQLLYGRSYRRNVSIERQLNHWQIAKEFRRLANASSTPAIILCSFPTIELAREATRFGRDNGVPTFLDIRDLWPDEILGRLPRAIRGVGRVLLAPLYANARRAMRDAKGLVAISDHFLQWGLAFAGRHRTECDQVFPMGYTGTLDAKMATDATREAILASGVNPSKRVFWFAGTFVGNIDLGTVIETARSLRAHSRIQFVLTGSGEREHEWRAQAEGLENVIFTGWAGTEQLAYLASIAWAGLGAYRKAASMSLPNKVFEYMSAGLPILLGLGGETRDLVVRNDIGLTYSAGEPDSLAAAVLRMAEDADLRDRMSQNASTLFRRQYSPQSLYGRYADFLLRAAKS